MIVPVNIFILKKTVDNMRSEWIIVNLKKGGKRFLNSKLKWNFYWKIVC